MFVYLLNEFRNFSSSLPSCFMIWCRERIFYAEEFIPFVKYGLLYLFIKVLMEKAQLKSSNNNLSNLVDHAK